MKHSYPTEFQTLSQDLLIKARSGSSEAAMAEAHHDFLNAAGERHRAELAQAPAPALLALIKADYQFLKALERTSTESCAQYGTHVSLKGRQVLWPEVPEWRDVAVAQWQASAAGRDSPAGWVPGPISADDARALFDAMRQAGISDRDLNTYSTAPYLEREPVETQCSIAISVSRALHLLPPQQAVRIARWMLHEKP
jgi:hypothetical protein